MCRCKEPITDNECRFLRKLHKDEKTFIYHIRRSDGKLLTAYVPKGSNPNSIAYQRHFRDNEGKLEYYFTGEHPCISEQNN